MLAVQLQFHLAAHDVVKFVNNLVRAVMVRDGDFSASGGNRSIWNSRRQDLGACARRSDDAPIVPGGVGLRLWGGQRKVRCDNKTDIPKEYLPFNCR
ncbi:MAG: hypothetical protein IPF55_04220 [Rhodoferax sp.]|nr:hypothetical protein [Rhodoferax sp.]